jgi:hypothetical protein
MKILKILPYLGLLIVFAFGVYLFIATRDQEKKIEYVTYISSSSSEISNKINEQSEAINNIGDFSNLSTQKIDELEKLSQDGASLIKKKKEEWNEKSKPSNSTKVDEQYSSFLDSAETVNTKYSDLITSIKKLENVEKVREDVGGYNGAVTNLSEVIKSLEKELNNLSTSNDLLIKLK